MKHLLLAVAACLAGLVAVAEKDPLAGAWTGFNSHVEFPGATGSLQRAGSEWVVKYDFAGGGHGVGMIVAPKPMIWAKTISFEARHGTDHVIGIVMTDSAGQSFRKVAAPAPGTWRRFTCDTQGGWIGHWGGPNDGVVRFPVKTFEVHLDRLRKGVPAKDDAGETRFRNFSCEEFTPEERASLVCAPNGPGVRYLLTDFTVGDRFTGGPRAFFRCDTRTAVTNGTLEVDFARDGRIDLVQELPVWGVPEEFLLTVEAPEAAAGAEFQLVFRTGGGPHATNTVCRLRKPVPGHGRIYQTFSIPGPFGEGWGRCWGKDRPLQTALEKSSRITSVVILRGGAKRQKMFLRLVRLEAVCRGGAARPPLLATPPTGSVAPRALDVAFLNLDARARVGAEIRVTMTDWEGRTLGGGQTPLPNVEPGARAVVSVPLDAVPGSLNGITYACALYEKGRRDHDVPGTETSWTRPVAGTGSSELRPDLPWGMGVYLHRTEGENAFSSAYALDTSDAGLARLEKRAELAQTMGVKWERAEFQPHRIAPEKGKFDFSFYDRLVDSAERHGISLYVIFSHYWPMRTKPYTQEAYDAWVETLRRCVERYRGRVKGWEIWNEPNIDFWTGPKEDYVKLVNMSYPVVKAADPAARVLTVSTAGVDLPFIDKCIGWGMKFDDITIHPYRAEPAEQGFLADLAAVTNRARGAKTWLTEMGWPTGCGPSTYSERRQAAYYVRAYLTAAGSGCVQAINGYNFVDDGWNALERENNFGVLRRDYTPKPAFRALAKVCRTFTAGVPSLETIPLGDGADAWIFRMGGRSALWASGHDACLAVKTSEPTRVTNAMDELLSEGACETTVRVGPLHVAFFDRDILSVQSRPLADSVPAPIDF